jgi:DNA polymerase V
MNMTSSPALLPDAHPTCFAIIDGNNFFVSCERVFNPALNNKPVIVLSNNDGCAIARSNEAKALGIPMGAPFHTFSHLIKPHRIKIFSSNFELYGDLSNRMMQILQTFTPDIEMYSIDEAFLNLAPLTCVDFTVLAQSMYDTILKQIGIPITVGIGPTKTLAKVANRVAKKQKIPFQILATPAEINAALKQTAIGDVWGIGRNLTLKLRQQGMYTAHDLASKDPRWARKTMTVVGERLVRELQGFSCLPLNSIEPDKQSIQVTRSFGVRLTERGDIEAAISTHATRLGEKLRKQNLVTPVISVFCRTSPFSNTPYYKGIGTIGFDIPTHDTPTLIKAAIKALGQAFKAGFIYQKAGIYAHGLVPKDGPKQKILFQKKTADSSKNNFSLCNSIDAINQRFGKDTAFWASSGIRPRHVMKQNQRSPRYTTRWSELKWVG